MDSRPVTVLHLITTLEVGGAEIMLWKILSFMDKQRFSNHVICLADIGPVGERIVSLGIPVHYLNMQKGRVTLGGLIKLLGLFRSIRPTILQCWLYHADLLGLIFGKISGVKYVYWNIRCSYMGLDNYRPSTRLTRKLCSLLSSFPTAVLSNSNQARIYHQALGYRTKRWKIIPNGFDSSRFRPDNRAKPRLLKELGISTRPSRVGNRKRDGDDLFLIGLVARFDPMKDHATFFKAACLLLSQRNDIHFILAGKGIEWRNKMIFNIIPDKWRRHFHLLGQRDDIENITAALDISSLASCSEGFPNTIGEAMACGVPCVVTDVGDSSYIVGDTGLVVLPQDPVAMAKAWDQILVMSSEDRRDLGMSARDRIISSFSIDRIVRKYEDFYSDSLEEI